MAYHNGELDVGLATILTENRFNKLMAISQLILVTSLQKIYIYVYLLIFP